MSEYKPGIRARIAALGYYTDEYAFFGEHDEIMQFTLYADELSHHKRLRVTSNTAYLEEKSDENLRDYLHKLISSFNDVGEKDT